jgi:enoyl-CoA hydratase
MNSNKRGIYLRRFEMETVLKKKIEEGIGYLIINRPKSMNALNSEVLNALDIALDDMAKEEIDVLIITGEGKAFIAGADISEMKSLNAEQGRAFGLLGAKVFRKLETFEKPTIAMINGYALGGGLELAMSCDIRMASKKAKLGQPETGLGITPGFSGTQRLSRLIGIARAKELIYTAKMIDADTAETYGLINHVVEAEELEEETLKMAKAIQKNAPLAVSYAKKAIQGGYEVSIDEGIRMESYLFGLCFASEDQKEGMNAFMEKRKAIFKNK